MLKLGIQIEEKDKELNIKLIDPTKKQLDSASDNELLVAQAIKDLLDKRLLELLEENTKTTEKLEK